MNSCTSAAASEGSFEETQVRSRVDIAGVLIDKIDLENTMARVAVSCEGRRSLQIVTANLNFITLARRHAFFKNAINNAGLTVADGRILLWLTRLVKDPAPEQITGHDLIHRCTELGRQKGYRMFLLGGKPGIAAALAKKLEAENPGLQVRGTDGGRFAFDGGNPQCDEVVKQVRRFSPHFLFVALGAPKQDVWIARNLEACGAAVAVGVGGVFDTLTGSLPRATRWMQVAGLESVYQLLVAPRRYWRRYLLDDPPTLLHVLCSIAVNRLRA